MENGRVLSRGEAVKEVRASKVPLPKPNESVKLNNGWLLCNRGGIKKPKYVVLQPE